MRCEYCQGNKPLLEYNKFGKKAKFKILPKSRQLLSDVQIGNGELTLNIPVNYCPNCGRLLTGGDS